MRSLAADLLMQRLATARATTPPTGVALEPTNRLLYGCIRDAILDGSLRGQARLPPSRDLAKELGISRNTVLFAYEQLLAEGYLRTLTGSGTFVADVRPETPTVVTGETGSPSTPPTHRLSTRATELLHRASASTVQWGAFMPGVPDVTAFAHQRFSQLLAKASRTGHAALRSYAQGGGHPALQRSLADYLRQARSVQCRPEQIIVTEGVHQAIDLAARVLADPGDLAWIEEPGYWGTRSILRMNGLRVQGIGIDAEGMQVMDPTPTEAAPRLMFVTPSHQYPLGPVMSLSRRLALLDLARQQGAWVVEDDYDSEFRFAGPPIPSLQGLRPHAPVIYIGTFSKTLYPGLRTAYMVLPESLVEPFRTAQMELYRGGHLLTQAALAAFIDSGHYAAHIRRMRQLYGARRARLIDLVNRRLGPTWIHRYDTHAGLHLVLSLPEGWSDVRVAQAAGEAGVLVRPLSRYYNEHAPEQGLLLGFGCVTEAQMAEPFEALLRTLAASRPAHTRDPTRPRRTPPADDLSTAPS